MRVNEAGRLRERSCFYLGRSEVGLRSFFVIQFFSNCWIAENNNQMDEKGIKSKFIFFFYK
jgi:hypothetical protein